jgi:hypothetical protein
MTAGRFYLLLSLGGVLTGLTVVETGSYEFWEEQQAIAKDLNGKLPYADRVDSFTEQLVRRVATDSLHDPSLAAMLKTLGVKVTEGPPQHSAQIVPALPTTPTPPAASTDAAPPAAPELGPSTNPAPTAPTLTIPPAFHP